jgi:hypothetical protein
MVITTPKAVARTLFSSTLSGETGQIICLNCIIAAALYYYAKITGLARDGFPLMFFMFFLTK